MKKQLLIISSALSSVCAVAQITVTSVDGPQLNQAVIQNEDTTNTQGPGANGPSITWNFASLLTHTADTIFFGPVAGTPAAATFASSGICVADPQDTTWLYLTNSSTALTIDGYYTTFLGGPPMPIVFNPPQKLLSYPCTYNSTFNNVAKTNFKVPYSSPPIDSIWFKQSINQVSAINAWGSLTTPYGTFNCLRQDYTDTRTDSIFGHAFGTWTFLQAAVDSAKGVRWWTNGKGFPVLEQDLDKVNGSVLSTRYLYFTLVGMNEAGASTPFILCYPNPASDEINFMTQENEGNEIIITDMQGKVVHKILVDETTETINTSVWANGIYHYTLISEGNAAPLSGKIVVTH